MLPSNRCKIGFHASHEQWPPSRLLEFVRRAEQAGFGAAMCSDHFHPWLDEQGHSGFTWSWLGSALQATNLSFGTVCAPGQRYHPAIVAQAAATLAEMYPSRFWLAVGSGEALNEHITGEPWPSKEERNDRLKESVDIMRALWSGELVNHDGLIRVVDAKLYSLPAEPPRIVGAALSEETARWVGSWADALITVGHDPKTQKETIDAFREGGGDGKPVILQTAISFASTLEEARHIAFHEWRQALLDGEQLADLEMPRDFAAATRQYKPEDISSRLRVSSDIKQHIEWLQQDLETGFDAVYVHPLGRNVEEFIDRYATEVLPVLKRD